MPSALVQVADAVTAAIAGHDFGIEFACERSYPDWDSELKETGCLRVDVLPVRHTESTLNTRGSVAYNCLTEIGIRRKFGQGEQQVVNGRIELSEVDRLVYLVEQIHELLCGWDKRQLAADIAWQDTEIRASYVPPHLKDWRQFTGIIAATYRVTRTLTGAPA